MTRRCVSYLFSLKWDHHLDTVLIGRKGVNPISKKLIPMTSEFRLIIGPPMPHYQIRKHEFKMFPQIISYPVLEYSFSFKS